MADTKLFADTPVATEPWRLLSEINANLQRRYEPQSALEIALQHRAGVRRLSCRARFFCSMKAPTSPRRGRPRCTAMRFAAVVSAARPRSNLIAPKPGSARALRRWLIDIAPRWDRRAEELLLTSRAWHCARRSNEGSRRLTAAFDRTALTTWAPAAP
jgi:hypothetical protein